MKIKHAPDDWLKVRVKVEHPKSEPIKTLVTVLPRKRGKATPAKARGRRGDG